MRFSTCKNGTTGDEGRGTNERYGDVVQAAKDERERGHGVTEECLVFDLVFKDSHQALHARRDRARAFAAVAVVVVVVASTCPHRQWLHPNVQARLEPQGAVQVVLHELVASEQRRAALEHLLASGAYVCAGTVVPSLLPAVRLVLHTRLQLCELLGCEAGGMHLEEVVTRVVRSAAHIVAALRAAAVGAAAALRGGRWG